MNYIDLLQNEYFYQKHLSLDPFRNPWDESDPEIMAMSDKKREYLKWAITEFNKSRFPGLTDAQINVKRKDSLSEYF